MADRPRTVLEGVYSDDLLAMWEQRMVRIADLEAENATLREENAHLRREVDCRVALTRTLDAVDRALNLSEPARCPLSEEERAWPVIAAILALRQRAEAAGAENARLRSDNTLLQAWYDDAQSHAQQMSKAYAELRLAHADACRAERDDLEEERDALRQRAEAAEARAANWAGATMRAQERIERLEQAVREARAWIRSASGSDYFDQRLDALLTDEESREGKE